MCIMCLYFSMHNHTLTLTTKISYFYVLTVKMSRIFENFIQFCIRYEVIKIFEILIKFSINLYTENPATARSRERFKVYIARLGT